MIKNKIKLLFVCTFIFTILGVVINVKAEEFTLVSTEEELKNAVQKEAKIKLNQNIEMTSTLTITNKIVLDLNGYTYSRKIPIEKDPTLIKVTGKEATLTIQDSSKEKTGAIIGNEIEEIQKLITVEEQGKLALESGKLENIKDSDYCIEQINGSVNINEGKIIGNLLIRNSDSFLILDKNNIEGNIFYHITQKNNLDAGVVVAQETASQGEKITVTITPKEHEILQKLEIVDSSNQEVTIESTTFDETTNTYTYIFTMPNREIKIHPIYKTYKITQKLGAGVKSNITNMETEVTYNTLTNFIYNAEEGYKISSIKVNGEEKITTLTDNNLSLKNLDKDFVIEVTATKIANTLLPEELPPKENTQVLEPKTYYGYIDNSSSNNSTNYQEKEEDLPVAEAVVYNSIPVEEKVKTTTESRNYYSPNKDTTPNTEIANINTNPIAFDNVVVYLVSSILLLIGIIFAIKEKKKNSQV